MSVKLLAKHVFEFLSLKGGCTVSSGSTLGKTPHCWKSRVAAHYLCFKQIKVYLIKSCLVVFPSQRGVFKGDNLYLNLFNIFVNDLANCFDETCMPILFREQRINCLLYADDLII